MTLFWEHVEQLLTERGWCKHVMMNESGAYCLEGAMMAAHTGLEPYVVTPDHLVEYDTDYRRFDWFKNDAERIVLLPVHMWNDDPNTNWGSVQGLLSKLKEKERRYHEAFNLDSGSTPR